MGKKYVIRHKNNAVRDTLKLKDGKEIKIDSIVQINNYEKPTYLYMSTDCIKLHLKDIPVVDKKIVIKGLFWDMNTARSLLEENPCLLLQSGKKHKRYILVMGIELFDVENIEFSSYKFDEIKEEDFIVEIRIKEKYGEGFFTKIIYHHTFDTNFYMNNVKERIKELNRLFELRMIYDAYVSIGLLEPDDEQCKDDFETGAIIIENCLKNYNILKNTSIEDVKRDYLLYYSSEYVTDKYRSMDYSTKQDMGFAIAFIEDKMVRKGLIFS